MSETVLAQQEITVDTFVKFLDEMRMRSTNLVSQ